MVIRDDAYYDELRQLVLKGGVPWYLGGSLAGTSRRALSDALDQLRKGNTMKSSPIAWLDDVEDDDFSAAFNYLSLKHSNKHAANLVDGLRETKCIERRANDILRATHLPPLSMDDPGVRHSLLKVLHGGKLSPVLVCDDDIADGYHRVSLAYNIDPFMAVPLRIMERK